VKALTIETDVVVELTVVDDSEVVVAVVVVVRHPSRS
jgi:hypothetical protein